MLSLSRGQAVVLCSYQKWRAQLSTIPPRAPLKATDHAIPWRQGVKAESVTLLGPVIYSFWIFLLFPGLGEAHRIRLRAGTFTARSPKF